MGSLERRVESLEAARMRREARPIREGLARLSDRELEALEESLDAEARARGEHPSPTNEILEEILEEMKRWEAETIDQQHRR